LDITVVAEEPKDSKLVAKITISAKDVDKAIAAEYKEIANKYNFQGFRKGRTPRPVIDSMVGRDAILADATNSVINEVEPKVLTELDVVPVGDVSYGDDLKPVVEGSDYVLEATITLRPEVELTSYDPVEINMPPAEATEAEIDGRVDLLLAYQTHLEDAPEGAEATKDDFIEADIEGDVPFAGENRLLTLSSGTVPEVIEEKLVGAKVGDVIDIEDYKADDDAEPVSIKITVKNIRNKVVPELTDEFANTFFGFENVAALRDAVKDEINGQKVQQLPDMKEARAVEALAQRLELETVPEDYEKQIFNEIGQNFIMDLQAQGMSVDEFLSRRHITMDALLNDMHEQAEEHARESLALDALAKHLAIEVTEEDVKKELGDAGIKDVDAKYEEFILDGRMPALRDTIRRSKADEWLIETAVVTEVDEAAQQAGDAE
jgi:trigger factor